MTARYFVDSNVIIYARDLTQPNRQARADQWTRHLWAARNGRLSYQVLLESYAVLTAAHKRRMTNDQARIYVASFEAWEPVTVGQPVVELAWRGQDCYGFNWWDSLIVAAAQLTECTHLLTEDL